MGHKQSTPGQHEQDRAPSNGMAPGRNIVSDRTKVKVIQPLERSLVQRILVKHGNRMKTSRTFFSKVILAASTCITLLASAGEQTPPPGGIPCEADWINRSRFDSVATVDSLKFLERLAERGEVAAQLRLGLVLKTRDGQWTVTSDRVYNIQWLEKAQAQGSKSATWQLAKIKHPNGHYRVTHEAYLRAAMAAAEEEGNPWAASELMNLTNGRFGQSRKPTRCLAEWMPDGKCAPEELLPISSARKWAEIAAEGGNAQAQEWLCAAALNGKPDRGQPVDDIAAYKWCQAAVQNACAYWSIDKYLFSVARVKGPEAFKAEAARIDEWKSQPWRQPSSQFFLPAQ